MDAVGLMLGLAGTLEQCLRHGRALVHFCRDLRNLSNTIDEMSFIIENIWQKMEEQVKLLRKIWDDPSLLPPLLQYLISTRSFWSPLTALKSAAREGFYIRVSSQGSRHYI